MNRQVFWYVDGIPTKGRWIDMEYVSDFYEIRQALVEGGFIPADYDGDILAADAEGLARGFIGNYGSFNLSDFIDCRDSEGDDDAKIAFIEWYGSWDAGKFEDCYIGDYSGHDNPVLEYAYRFVDDCYNLDQMMGKLSAYFDYEKFARDLQLGGYIAEHNGHLFHNPPGV